MLEDHTVRQIVRRTKVAFLDGVFAGPYGRKKEPTLAHSRRVSTYTRILAECMVQSQYGEDALHKLMSPFSDEDTYLTGERILDLEVAARLHDIGKLRIPGPVLYKAERLTPEEEALVHKHAKMGLEILTQMEESFANGGLSSMQEPEVLEFFRAAQGLFRLEQAVANCHHVHWDGKGYPDLEIEGEQIPISARIVAVADTYDALTAPRSYKETFEHTSAVKLVEGDAETRLDPKIVEIFLSHQDRFVLQLGIFQDEDPTFQD